MSESPLYLAKGFPFRRENGMTPDRPISELFAQKRPIRSLEFFPPKDDAGVELLAVSLDERWSAIDFFFDGSPPAEVVKSEQGHREFGVTELPDSYLVRADGSLAGRIEGARDWSSPAAYDALRSALTSR